MLKGGKSIDFGYWIFKHPFFVVCIFVYHLVLGNLSLHDLDVINICICSFNSSPFLIEKKKKFTLPLSLNNHWMNENQAAVFSK